MMPDRWIASSTTTRACTRSPPSSAIRGISATDNCSEKSTAAGTRELIAKAVEAELAAFLDAVGDRCLDDGRRAVVRNGYLLEHTVQTGIGDVAVRVPKVRDRSGGAACFRSELLPPYIKPAADSRGPAVPERPSMTIV